MTSSMSQTASSLPGKTWGTLTGTAGNLWLFFLVRARKTGFSGINFAWERIRFDGASFLRFRIQDVMGRRIFIGARRAVFRRPRKDTGWSGAAVLKRCSWII